MINYPRIKNLLNGDKPFLFAVKGNKLYSAVPLELRIFYLGNKEKGSISEQK